MITRRDFQILLAVAMYDVLLRSQVTDLLFPEDTDGRLTRKRMHTLVSLGLLNVTHMRTVNPSVMSGVSAPVYYMSGQGAEFLAQETGENMYKLCNTTPPHHLYLYHFVAVSAIQMMLRKACDLLGDIEVDEWIGERTLANPTEKEPHKKYRLYQRFDDKLCSIPDAGFVLKKGNAAKVYILELDRDTTKSADRVAAQKCGGLAAMFDRKTHAKIFPQTTLDKFNVLCIAPTLRRRDALRKAVVKKRGEFWKFCSQTDLTPESILTGPVWYQGEEETPRSLMLKEATV